MKSNPRPAFDQSVRHVAARIAVISVLSICGWLANPMAAHGVVHRAVLVGIDQYAPGMLPRCIAASTMSRGPGRRFCLATLCGAGTTPILWSWAKSVIESLNANKHGHTISFGAAVSGRLVPSRSVDRFQEAQAKGGV